MAIPIYDDPTLTYDDVRFTYDGFDVYQVSDISDAIGRTRPRIIITRPIFGKSPSKLALSLTSFIHIRI